jgi:hypothetical protein
MLKLAARIRTFISRPGGIVVLAAVGVAFLGLIEGFLYAPSVAVLLRIVAVCALLGAFLGTIYATDPRSGLTVTKRPILRSVVSAAVGLIGAMVLGLSAPSVVLVGGVTAALGWLGMAWAQYVDF